MSGDAGLASTRPGRGRARGGDAASASSRTPLLHVLGASLVVAYPILIYFGLARFETRSLAVLLLVALGLRAVFAFAAASDSSAGREHLRALALQLSPVVALVALSAWFADHRFLLALPVFVSVALLIVFARSLRAPMPIVERFARVQDPDLSEAEVRHCARVTRVWCAFFAVNAAIAAALALAAPIAWWTLYTGLIAYLAMGALFAGEFLVRRARFGRFGDGPIDRLARRFVGRPGADARTLERGSASEHDSDPGAGNAQPAERLGWTQVAEKGSVLGVRFVLFLCLLVGRTPVRAVMRAVAFYYLISDANLRRVSREFHERLGLPPTLAAIYRHIRTFAFCSTDRIFLLRGEKQLFQITRNGRENGERVRRAGRGGIMIGAHFGSFEALRATAEYDDLPLSIVAWFENAAISNAVFESLDPELARRVIQVRPGEVGYLLEVRRRIQAGELVAFLGDRAMPGTETVAVDFLGEPAHFPTGAFSIAAAIGCPVVLIFGVYREPNVYEMHCEAFADRIELPRRGAVEQKRALVQRYANRLEHYVREAPTNWFNFYDFWDQR